MTGRDRRPGDRVLDLRGGAWQFDGDAWTCTALPKTSRYSTEDLVDTFGPVTPVADGGKPVGP